MECNHVVRDGRERVNGDNRPVRVRLNGEVGRRQRCDAIAVEEGDSQGQSVVVDFDKVETVEGRMGAYQRARALLQRRDSSPEASSR